MSSYKSCLQVVVKMACQKISWKNYEFRENCMLLLTGYLRIALFFGKFLFKLKQKKGQILRVTLSVEATARCAGTLLAKILRLGVT